MKSSSATWETHSDKMVTSVEYFIVTLIEKTGLRVHLKSPFDYIILLSLLSCLILMMSQGAAVSNLLFCVLSAAPRGLLSRPTACGLAGAGGSGGKWPAQQTLW